MVLALLALALPVEGQASPPRLEIRAVGVTDGHATLAWSFADEAGAEPEFELQSARTADFAEPLRCYRGPDRATFRSGMPAGEHHFRVRARGPGADAAWGPWSATVTVTIRPYPLATAWTLFAVGAVLVSAVVAYITRARLTEARGGNAA